MNKCLMIVDDDEEDRDFFCQAAQLVDASIKCIEAIDGEEGLRILKAGKVKPACIFLDLNMPRISGMQFLKEIKKIEQLRSIPVVIYTTSKQSREKIEASDLGAAMFVTKPTRIEEIQKVIVFMLENAPQTGTFICDDSQEPRPLK